MPIEPQKQYIHQEYPKVIGYLPSGRAIIAQNQEHHEVLKAEHADILEPKTGSDDTSSKPDDPAPIGGDARRRARIALQLAKQQARVIEEERGEAETGAHQADPHASE